MSWMIYLIERANGQRL